MVYHTVTLKVKNDVAKVANELVELGIVKSRNQAYNLLIEIGINKAKQLIERKRKVKLLVEKWLKEGLPFENLPTHEDVEEERSR